MIKKVIIENSGLGLFVLFTVMKRMRIFGSFVFPLLLTMSQGFTILRDVAQRIGTAKIEASTPFQIEKLRNAFRRRLPRLVEK